MFRTCIPAGIPGSIQMVGIGGRKPSDDAEVRLDTLEEAEGLPRRRSAFSSEKHSK